MIYPRIMPRGLRNEEVSLWAVQKTDHVIPTFILLRISAGSTILTGSCTTTASMRCIISVILRESNGAT